MLPLLVDACPSFCDKWKEHKDEYKDEEDFLPYIALTEFAGHLIELHGQNNTAEFASVFETVERLHVQGDQYVREAATVGLLESIQNRLSSSEQDAEIFRAYLLPVSAKWWDQLMMFWNGEINYVGETLDN